MKVESRAGVHHLKSWPEPFGAVLSGAKRFELRFNDRDFRVGDLLVLHEWEPGSGALTSRWFAGRVTYAIYGASPDSAESDLSMPWQHGVAEGWCALGFRAVREDQELPRDGQWPKALLYAVAGYTPKMAHRVTKTRRASK